MVNLKDLLVMLFRFIATTIGITMNVKRISSTKNKPLDDILFVLAIFTGFYAGFYWDSLMDQIVKRI
jgi:formate-dependent nitrite reductase membrane component NrfD